MITKEFEEIYREYYSPVYAFLLRLTGGGTRLFRKNSRRKHSSRHFFLFTGSGENARFLHGSARSRKTAILSI